MTSLATVGFQVKSVALQSDNKIILGGAFSTYGATSTNDIVRINADGSVDSSFDPGTGSNYEVNHISIQSDGKIIVGGWFQSFNGVTFSNIVRLNTDGSFE